MLLAEAEIALVTRPAIVPGQFVDLNVSPGHRWLALLEISTENRSQLSRSIGNGSEQRILRRLVRRFLVAVLLRLRSDGGVGHRLVYFPCPFNIDPELVFGMNPYWMWSTYSLTAPTKGHGWFHRYALITIWQVRKTAIPHRI